MMGRRRVRRTRVREVRAHHSAERKDGEDERVYWLDGQLVSALGDQTGIFVELSFKRARH